MQDLDVNINARIGSCLHKVDLINYIITFKIKNNPIFWIEMLRYSHPEFYRDNIIRTDWKLVYRGILFIDEYEYDSCEREVLAKSVKMFNDAMISNENLTSSGDCNLPLNSEDKIILLNKYITSVPKYLNEKWYYLSKFYKETCNYLLVNRFVILNDKDANVALEYLDDHQILKLLIKSSSIEPCSSNYDDYMILSQKVLSSGNLELIEHLVNSPIEIIDPIDHIFKISWNNYLRSNFYTVLRCNEGISIETFEYISKITVFDMLNIIHIIMLVNDNNIKLINFIINKPEYTLGSLFGEYIDTLIFKDMLIKLICCNKPSLHKIRLLLDKYNHYLTNIFYSNMMDAFDIVNGIKSFLYNTSEHNQILAILKDRMER